jgi:hypothetical protein
MDRIKDKVGGSHARYIVGHVSIPDRYFYRALVKRHRYSFFPLRL